MSQSEHTSVFLFMEFVTLSPAETHALAQTLLKDFPEHRFWCLYGPLGAGKTAFAQGFGMSLGLPVRSIKSPTYTYVREHPLAQGGIFYHCDLYRSASAQDWIALGIQERITSDDHVLVEWADRLEDALPARRLDLHFTVVSPTHRSIIVTPYD